jgi:DMSO/TMAO reductase YedYZ molybdopterin-dependent catalytic subunit
MSVCQDDAVAVGDHREGGLPPGQRPARGWPVVHYGPVPRLRPEIWDLRVFGATASGEETRLDAEAFAALPTTCLVGDLHCDTKWTVSGIEWAGLAASDLLRLVPPSPAATHVMVHAEYGYSANLPLAVFGAPDTVLATHAHGQPLTPDHGYPLRLVCPSLYAWKSAKWVREVEYLSGDRRGFWEERGYHNRADPWLDERYSYQE